MSEEKPSLGDAEQPETDDKDQPKPDANGPKSAGNDKPKPAADNPKIATNEKPKGMPEDESEPDFSANLDGSMTLEQTKNRCEVEQDAGLQLRGIRFKTLTADSAVLLVNKADFVDKPIGRLKHLLFDPVGTKDPAKLIKQRVEAEKWTLICDSQIYVEENVTRVLVFGRRRL
jgi:hypothetical protein